METQYPKTAENGTNDSSAKNLPQLTNASEEQRISEQQDLSVRKLDNLRRDRRRAIMIAMWTRMGDYLGLEKWKRHYGTKDGTACAAWTTALYEFDEDDIASAITSCQVWDGFDPPTLPQFRAMVVAIRKNREPTVTSERLAYEREVEAGNIVEHLESIAKTPVAIRELERMKRILAGEEVETREQALHNLQLRVRWPDVKGDRWPR